MPLEREALLCSAVPVNELFMWKSVIAFIDIVLHSTVSASICRRTLYLWKILLLVVMRPFNAVDLIGLEKARVYSLSIHAPPPSSLIIRFSCDLLKS